MATADWASLPRYLVNRVADVFLATSDIDYYMSLRAVCHDWRAATSQPRGMASRFRPRHWIMLDAHNDWEVDSRLFLNLATGRFLMIDIPPLKHHCYFFASSDGLLVLEEFSDASYIRVINPFTRFVVQFLITLPSCAISIAVAGSSKPALFIFFDQSRGTCVHGNAGVFWKDPTMQFKAEPILRKFAAVETFQGRVYTADTAGTVAVVHVDSSTPFYYTDPRPTAIIAGCWETEQAPTFLVGSAGELLLVRAPASKRMKAFRVDLVRKALEPMRSIGGRALFLGKECLSVDARNLPSIEANCVYYGNRLLGSSNHQMFVHHLDDGRVEMLTDPLLHTGDFMDLIDRPGPMILAKYILNRNYNIHFRGV